MTFLSKGNSLQSFGIPFNPLAKPKLETFFDPIHQRYGPLAQTLTLLLAHLNGDDDKTQLVNCKEIDFATFHYYTDETLQSGVEYHGSPAFLQLCDKCSKTGIKLVNVASSWFQAGHDHKFQEYSADLGKSIVSLVNIDPRMLAVNMPNLEKIQMKTSQSCPSIVFMGEQQDRPEWPSLISLDITVDSKKCAYYGWSELLRIVVSGGRDTDVLYSFLFEDVSRIAMTELKLTFKQEEGQNLPVPQTEMIVASCPNIRKLTMVNWLGSEEALTKFWSGLPSLEEVALEGCKDVGDAAFVGNDVKAPVFLKLTKLKKLTLKGLDQMPKITDTLFSLVIRHLELTHLFLSSEAPVKSVTMCGVQSLCDGKFAESIEKFPFQDWQLSNVSAEEFKEHEVMFRSYNML